MPKFEKLSSRMKHYESLSSGQLMPFTPCMARLDGKAFHTFTKNLNKPYDIRLSNLMIDTTRFLVEETNAKVGYTQSDEISLVYLEDTLEEILFFDRKILKMSSILAGMASVFFNKNLKGHGLEFKEESFPLFDCRVWSLPNKAEACNAILWREQDAIRNSVQMAARSCYSHNQLDKKNNSQLLEMLREKGIDWNAYPSFFKRGTYIQKRITQREFTSEEVSALPIHHEYRKNPNLKINRTDYIELDMPPLSSVRNREEVIFNGQEPEI